MSHAWAKATEHANHAQSYHSINEFSKPSYINKKGIVYLSTSTIFEKKLSSGKRGAGLDSPFATLRLLLIALPDFVTAAVVIVVGCHSKHSFDSMVYDSFAGSDNFYLLVAH
jgi:hypothetical protein